MRYLGIDYGEKKLGLALSDGILASPYSLRSKIKDPLFARKLAQSKQSKIQEICQKEKVGIIIIGISEGTMANKTRNFAEELKKITGLPVVYQDETLTSQEAVKKMIEAGKKKKYRQEKQHHIAACIILQNYLDSH